MKSLQQLAIVIAIAVTVLSGAAFGQNNSTASPVFHVKSIREATPVESANTRMLDREYITGNIGKKEYVVSQLEGWQRGKCGHLEIGADYPVVKADANKGTMSLEVPGKKKSC